ncbi:hypothetical protein OEZ86_001615 [Tetradesmus obliquus]|nr:hypothetical protein OEZ86_001615 [Tetradesmus obliquus]
MGSSYPTIAADVLARFQRLSGKRVRFLTGTDEHGEKIALAAAARSMSPQEHCDNIVQAYKELWAKLDIAYDGFIRTTDSQHEALVQEVLQRVWDKGDIYKASYSGWYCVDCEEYKDEKEMDGEHNCPTHRRPCQHREEENYFFALSKYQAQLEALLEGSGSFVQPASRRNEVLGWVREGVRDFSISRSAVQWGIPMRQDPSHTVYVWFDALNGYLSGLLPLADNAPSSSSSSSSVEAALAQGWPADVHVIGKDILRFHAIYWPGMLMSAGLPLPKQVFGHGFLTKDGLKMGKALGNTLDPEALVNAYGADAVRLFFMKEVAFGQDGNFSESAFRDTVNATLANSVGNMLNRTLGLLRKNYEAGLPCSAAEAVAVAAGEEQQQQQHPLVAVCEQQVAAAAAAYGKLAPHQAVEAVLAISAAGNLYLEQTAPWSALKKGSDEEKAAAGRVLVAVLETARILAVALSPITPGLSSRIYQQLGLGEGALDGRVSWSDTAWGQLQAGHCTAAPQPVFARLDDTVPFVTEPAPGAAAAAPAGGKGGGGGGGKKQQQKQQKQQKPKEAATAAAAS